MVQARDGLGDEVHKLLDAVQEWARRLPEQTAAAPNGAAEADADAHNAGGCLPWCPVCQLANVLRGEHPEVTERLAEAASAVAAAMKALADTALTRAQPDTTRSRPRPTPRVQHIRIDDPSAK